MSNFSEDIAKLLNLTGEKITDTMIDTLISKDKIATGNLIQSITYQSQQTEEGASVTISVPGYGKFVDEGRKPGDKMPPVQPILAWIQARRIRTPEYTQPQLAWAIAKSIAKRGIKPTPFIENSISFALTNFANELENIAGPAIAAEINDSIKVGFPEVKITQS